jgi:hypothetical protein
MVRLNEFLDYFKALIVQYALCPFASHINVDYYVKKIFFIIFITYMF